MQEEGPGGLAGRGPLTWDRAAPPLAAFSEAREVSASKGKGGEDTQGLVLGDVEGRAAPARCPVGRGRGIEVSDLCGDPEPLQARAEA